MSLLARSLKTTVAAAVCAVGLSLAHVGAAQAELVQVRDGNGGNVFGAPGFQTITVQVNGSNQSVNAGAFALQYRYGTSGNWTDFLTYCLEPDVLLANYSPTNIISGNLALASDTAEYAAKASILSDYYNTWYEDSLKSSVKSAAFQVGLWELAYDTKNTGTSSNLNNGDFRYKTSGSILNQAQSYLNAANWKNQAEIGIIVNSNPDRQDLVVVLPPQPAEDIPEPASLALFCLGLAGLGLAIRRHVRVATGAQPQG